MAKADFGVFIGRFQPLHNGHAAVIRGALERVQRLIVLVGSANCARDPRNPFTYDERTAMFRATFAGELAEGRIILAPLDDHPYADADWVAEVRARVKAIVLDAGNAGGFRANGLADFRIALAGHSKDATSYYLDLFPEWEDIRNPRPQGTFSAADIRSRYFRRIPDVPAAILPAGVARWLEGFAATGTFAALLAEAEYLADYPRQWGAGPFVTADAVVVQGDRVLLIERGGLPGKGLLALPGGFVGPDETVRSAMLRELIEETAIAGSNGALDPVQLASFIDEGGSRVFDAPARSLRGRVITHAFLLRLPGDAGDFTVRGADDAAFAHWHRIADLSPAMLFEDHHAIITRMTGAPTTLTAPKEFAA